MARFAAAILIAAGLGLATPAVAAPAPAAPATASPAPVDPAPVDPAALATAREIIRIGFPEDRRAAMFGNATDALSTQMRATMMRDLDNNPGAKAIVDRHLDAYLAKGKLVLAAHIPALMDAFAVAYAHEFSRAELADLLAFVRTPTGVHFLTRSASLLSDPAVAAANSAYLRELQPLIGRMRDEMLAELVPYLAAHPSAPAHGS